MPTFVRRQEIEHPIGPTGRLALNATSSDVVFEAVDGATARVAVEFELIASTEADADALFERVRFHARQGDGVLDVSEPKRGDTRIGRRTKRAPSTVAKAFGKRSSSSRRVTTPLSTRR